MDRTISIEMYSLLVNTLMILGVSSLLRVLFAVIFKKKKRIIFLIHNFIVVVLFDYFLFKFHQQRENLNAEYSALEVNALLVLVLIANLYFAYDLFSFIRDMIRKKTKVTSKKPEHLNHNHFPSHLNSYFTPLESVSNLLCALGLYGIKLPKFQVVIILK